jgi:hypothetical protein
MAGMGLWEDCGTPETNLRLKRFCSHESEEDDGMTRYIALLAILVGVTACGSSPGDRALTVGPSVPVRAP